MPDRRIGSYAVQLFSGPTGAGGVRARILLLDPTNVPNGTILFHHDGQVIPPPVVGATTMHVPAATLPAVLDLLRNEKPLFLDSDRRGPFLSTSPEPQGEGE